MKSETSEASSAAHVYLILQQECSENPWAVTSEAWKGKEITIELPGVVQEWILQSPYKKSRQVFRWAQEVFAESADLMFLRMGW